MTTITDFGKFLRNFRMDNGERLKTMAEKLQVAPSFLSAVENGKKPMPSNWVEKISSEYNLSREQRTELQNSVCKTNGQVTIDITDLSEDNVELAFSFAQRLGSLNGKEVKKIRDILVTSKGET